MLDLYERKEDDGGKKELLLPRGVGDASRQWSLLKPINSTCGDDLGLIGPHNASAVL